MRCDSVVIPEGGPLGQAPDGVADHAGVGAAVSGGHSCDGGVCLLVGADGPLPRAAGASVGFFHPATVADCTHLSTMIARKKYATLAQGVATWVDPGAFHRASGPGPESFLRRRTAWWAGHRRRSHLPRTRDPIQKLGPVDTPILTGLSTTLAGCQVSLRGSDIGMSDPLLALLVLRRCSEGGRVTHNFGYVSNVSPGGGYKQIVVFFFLKINVAGAGRGCWIVLGRVGRFGGLSGPRRECCGSSWGNVVRCFCA